MAKTQHTYSGNGDPNSNAELALKGDDVGIHHYVDLGNGDLWMSRPAADFQSVDWVKIYPQEAPQAEQWDDEGFGFAEIIELEQGSYVAISEEENIGYAIHLDKGGRVGRLAFDFYAETNQGAFGVNLYDLPYYAGPESKVKVEVEAQGKSIILQYDGAVGYAESYSAALDGYSGQDWLALVGSEAGFTVSVIWDSQGEVSND